MFRNLLRRAPSCNGLSSRRFSANTRSSRVSESSPMYLKATALSISIAILGTVFLDHSQSDALNVVAVKKDIADAIEKEDESRGDGTSIGPTLIRLAWHSSGTYSIFDRTGGSSGAGMRFAPESQWGANAGLDAARKFLEPIKNKYGLSYSDTWSLAGGY